MDRLIDPALHGDPVAWFAPTYRMLNENFRAVRHTLAPVVMAANDTQKRIELITGGIIDMWSLDVHDSARGRKYKRVVINEAAQARNLADAWAMVIRPTLADLQGDAWFLSTPRGLNEFYSLYQKADDDQAWRHWKMPTAANPYIKAAEIEAMRSMLPERVFQQEIMAQFVEDGSYFENVDQCAVIAAPDAPEAHALHHVVMGVDWAKSHDWTVLTVACRDCMRVVDWQRFNQIDYHYQRARLLEMAQRWRVSNIMAESNSIGEPNIEELRIAGLNVEGFQTTVTTKAALIEALHMALARDGFKIPTDYRDELLAFEITARPNLPPKFGAPDGMHDDRVISLALAWQLMSVANAYSESNYAEPYQFSDSPY